MRLDLRNIINIPGGEIPFEYQPDLSDLSFDSLKSVAAPVTVTGVARNEAGMLIVDGNLSADTVCFCARCLKEFPKHISLEVHAKLASELSNAESEENDDIFLLDGDYADLDEIFITAFVLDVDQRFLCDEDCKGLCSKCGKDLNNGPCECRDEGDPRLAVLWQLLENED